MDHLTEKQKEALKHPLRKAIYDHLLGEEKPQTLGEIAEGVEVKELAVVYYQLARVMEVDLVEKLLGTVHYRVVER